MGVDDMIQSCQPSNQLSRSTIFSSGSKVVRSPSFRCGGVLAFL